LYFGYEYMRAYLGYFGVDADAVGYATTDYLLASVAVLYAPLLALLLTWAIGLGAGQYARRLLEQGRHAGLVRNTAVVVTAIGVIGVLRGLVGVMWPHFFWLGDRAVTPIALGGGLTLIGLGYWTISASADRRGRAVAPAERVALGLACAMMVLALFWIVNIFADKYGQNRAQADAASLWTKETSITIYTDERLDVPSNLIVETPVTEGQNSDGHPATSYRYRCFRKLAVRGSRWVLIPARWTPEFGYAVIVDAGDRTKIAITRLKGIDQTPAADWNGAWPCPEVAPA